MAVVNNLKEIREERGLLQEDLASATGFCTKTIGRVERGERAPSAEFMLRIAAFGRCSYIFYVIQYIIILLCCL